MEEKGVLQILKEAVMESIAEGFGMVVYGEGIPQKGKMPCFGVSIQKVIQKGLLAGRREQWVTLEIVYETRDRTDSTEKAEGLYELLSVVGKENNRFLACRMEHYMTEKGFLWEVVYYIQLRQVIQEEKMQRLEHNGRKAVGYGEK